MTKDELKRERVKIILWFNAHDYMVNKVFLGEWESTDQRFVDYKTERFAKRQRLEEINILLGGM